MIEARPNQTSDWPEREVSAYVDWWKHAEYRAALPASTVGNPDDPRPDQPDDAPSAMGKALRLVRFTCADPRQSGPSARYRPGWAAPDPDCAKGPARARSVPLWPGSLPFDAGGSAPESGPQPGDGMTLSPVANPEFGEPLASAGQRPPAVMVVIDTQINPLHEQFLDGAGGHRIVAHWLMEGRWRPDGRVPYGRELRGADLAAARQRPTEDAGLRALGVGDLADPFGSRDALQCDAHGTHVLGLAAGTDPQDRSAAAQSLRGVPILAVSLPCNRLLSASGVFLDVFVDQALAWTSARLADLFGDAPPPVVANLSYGLAAGPKDGTGLLNRRLRDWLCAHPQVRLFMPAGNDGLAQGHAVLHPSTSAPEIGWLVPPADPQSTYAEVWLSQADEDTRLCLYPPGQVRAVTLPLVPGRVFDLAKDAGPSGDACGRVYVLPAESAFRRVGCLICLGPTRPRRAGAPAAPAGVWGIGIAGPADLRATVDLQSERSVTPHSRVSPAARLVQISATTAAPQRAGTLNAIGPGTGAILVNGTDLAMLRRLTRPGTEPRPAGAAADAAGEGPPVAALARWTSRGDAFGFPPTSDGLFHPADRSRARPGLIAPGYRSGSTAIVQGTSFSTALASRAALQALLAPPPFAG